MEIFIKITGLVTLFILLVFILALPTMWLWNWLMPVIFGLTEITFWQALGINILAGILFRTKVETKK